MAARQARECLGEVEGLVAREGDKVTKEEEREKDDRQEDGQHGYSNGIDVEEKEQDGDDDGDDGGEGNRGDDSDGGDEEEDERSVGEEALETHKGQHESSKRVEVEEEEKQDGDDDDDDDDDGDDDGDELEEGERSVRAQARERQMCVERHVEGVTGGRTVADYGCRKTVEAVGDKHMRASLWRHGLMRMTCGMSDNGHLGSATTQFACCCRSRSSNAEAQRNSAERLNRGAKPAEVYGFVSSIVVAVAYVVFLVWAYTPEEWLHAIGVTYYPSRYWAIAIPAFVPVAVVFAVSVYLSLCLIHTQPPDSVNTIYDDYAISRQQAAEEQKLAFAEEETEEDTGEELPIPPVCDIPIIEVNDILFGTRSQFHSWDFVPDRYQQHSLPPRGRD
ncbi:hypothetical protein CBR_g12382 [Chara braunii]|uniref:PIG-P domain-containing protein n=1 Tax=Chara braunii TaxID=69332 RepID=A0A388KRW5_CHABU|nr:hypothetical protein CBR_g12382 [Chara braunii]|eukprot:GBG72815.1 hypothetical protein CBR_g12382 [Chara braunii]